MEGDVGLMVLRGDRDIGNEVNMIDYEALMNVVATVEPPQSPANHPEQLEILSLSLDFSPFPCLELDSFLQVLDDTPLVIPIILGYTKEKAKTPHLLTVSSSSDSLTLLEIAALDPTCPLAQKWCTLRSPPPLTKAGQKFKNVKSAAAQRAKQRSTQVQVPVVGGGGLLDALVVLGWNQASSGVKLEGELVPQKEKFTINLRVFIEPTKFYPFPFSRAKQLILNRVFPSNDDSTTTPDEATIDWFYRSLRRAPITRDGLTIELPVNGPLHAARPIETQEERDARLRREAKGKFRAIEEPINVEGPLETEFDEDVLLRPKGLEVELYPFQSRSVRWMLKREGKFVEVLRGDELAQYVEKEKEEKKREQAKKRKAKEKDKEKGRGKGKGKKKVIEEESEDSVSEEEDEDEMDQVVVLKDLDTKELDNMRRGSLWEQKSFGTVEGDEIRVWLNRVTGQISQDDPLGGDQEQTVVKMELEDEEEEGEEEETGVVGGFEGHGLLADEVGTGKTVTSVSLVLLHTDPQRNKLPNYYNSQTDAQVQPTGLTLIVCPTSISQQWMQELERLAPDLRILRYDGIKSLKKSFTPSFIAKSFDLVLTTFDVLRREVTIARKPHVRALRNQANRTPKYRRSLLVEIDWMRVIADETQMVGDAFSATSETLSLIPRQFSWAVTSTPLRDKIEDVRPLLTYLRVEPIASSRASLSRLLEEPDCFKRLFEEIGERTLKSQVQNEMVLPKQTRLIVPLDFTAVERFYYDSRYGEMLQALGLTADGTPRVRVNRRGEQVLEWNPDKAEMNRWLGVLRALTAHPQVGAAGRQALGRVLKTVDEVYTSMREQAVSAIQTDQRAILSIQVKRGQLLMWDKDVEDRFETALKLFETVVEKSEPIIEAVAQEIHAAWKERRKTRSETSTSPASLGVTGALQIGFASDEGQEKDSLSDRERAFARSLSGLRNRLRDLLFVKHSALFFRGHAYFNLKKEQEETEAYAAAERLRQVLLQSYEDHVEKAQTTLMTTLEERDQEESLDVTDLELPFNQIGHGIVALSVYEDIEITSDILNGYAELIFQYRQMIIDMILKTVSIAGDNATGEEYEERAVLQEKLEVYLEAFTVLLGEWSYGILGTRSQLGDSLKAEQAAIFFTEENLLEPSPKKSNGRKRKAKQAGLEDSDEEGDSDEDEGDETSSKQSKKGKGKRTRVQKKRNANIKNNSIKDFRPPTLETGFTPADCLRYELLVERIEAMGEGREFSEIIPLRHLIKKLKEASESSHRDAEIALLERERKRISKALASLDKVADRLRNELVSFNTAYNARVLYFKNLQAISDSVVDPDLERGLVIPLEELRLQEQAIGEQLAEKEKRKRYLDNLNTPDEEEEHTCPICADTYNDGVLLACVHLICRACFKNWYARSKTCPLCKATIHNGSWESVKYRHKGKNNGVQAQEEVDGKDQTAEEKENLDEMQGFEASTPTLSEISETELETIHAIETAAPLSRKSDFVVKLTKYLRRREPECKIVIFSVWQEALQLLMESFDRNGLLFVRLEGSTAKGKREGVVKKFIEDPDISAFFLHTRSAAAGLTLNCARYMILLEPLLAPQLEVQATARIWRIGQTKETTIFQFMVRGTPDERIAELRARTKTSLFVAQEGHDAGKESELGQQQSLASKEARSKSKSEASAEALDDEDDIARCLLSAQHYLALQKSLLPRDNPLPPLPPLPQPQPEQVVAEEDHEMTPAGIAAAGRLAMEIGGSGGGGFQF